MFSLGVVLTPNNMILYHSLQSIDRVLALEGVTKGDAGHDLGDGLGLLHDRRGGGGEHRGGFGGAAPGRARS